ncbi:futalosine hydrolase [Desulfoscipio gibsoniae]|uniref:Futalosine hydrolase n=1 Tax=Desulfoscipio gibsoniae DSM 7213 TaxID=767817 RepID=R4KD93_9FIRM|nr:futalosine hydrolase [Desulfoscipio gibsoniae]AGK99671.1 futalosine nucleosidase [Desulfoscipio gibsoniae DSM 7213]
MVTSPYKRELGKRVLIMTAVQAEMEVVLSGLHRDRGSDKGIDVLVAGIGPVAAAVSTLKALLTAEYNLVVNAGIGGGFSGRAEVGSLVVANKIVAADLGVETFEGFSNLDELSLGTTSIQVDNGLVQGVTEALLAAGLPVKTGPVLTVSTVTGTAESAAKLAARVPGAAAEAMEGYGVAVAAREQGLPIIELRAISNLVGPRDRAAWRIKDALGVLEKASLVLSEVLL